MLRKLTDTRKLSVHKSAGVRSSQSMPYLLIFCGRRTVFDALHPSTTTPTPGMGKNLLRIRVGLLRRHRQVKVKALCLLRLWRGERTFDAHKIYKTTYDSFRNFPLSCLFFPSHLLSLLYFLQSPPFRSSDSDPHSRHSSSLTTTCDACMYFYREKRYTFSSTPSPTRALAIRERQIQT